MKIIRTGIIAIILLLLQVPAFSQRSRRNRFEPFTRQTQFSVGAEFASILPQGLGIGLSVRYEQPLKIIDGLTVLATVGLIAYGSSASYNTPGGYYTARTKGLWIPVMGGAKYYYPGPIFRGFYGSLEAGPGFGSASVHYVGGITTGKYVGADNLGNIAVAPGIGYHNGIVDFSLRYYSVGMVSVRVGYVLGRR